MHVCSVLAYKRSRRLQRECAKFNIHLTTSGGWKKTGGARSLVARAEFPIHHCLCASAASRTIVAVPGTLHHSALRAYRQAGRDVIRLGAMLGYSLLQGNTM